LIADEIRGVIKISKKALAGTKVCISGFESNDQSFLGHQALALTDGLLATFD
jgi:hypothetical protein